MSVQGDVFCKAVSAANGIPIGNCFFIHLTDKGFAYSRAALVYGVPGRIEDFVDTIFYDIRVNTVCKPFVYVAEFFPIVG